MQNLSCEQVIALLTFYIEKKLTNKLMLEVEYHLNSCGKCKTKYAKLLNLYENYEEIKENIDNTSYFEQENFAQAKYKNFTENLSAYIDNELDENENIKIKKIAIINPEARLALENMLNFQYQIKSAFDITKSKLKKDYAAEIINSLHKNFRNKSPKLKLNYQILILAITVTLILIGIFYQ